MESNQTALLHSDVDGSNCLSCPYEDPSDVRLFMLGANEAIELYDQCPELGGEFSAAYFQYMISPRELKAYFRGMLDSFRHLLGRESA